MLSLYARTKLSQRERESEKFKLKCDEYFIEFVMMEKLINCV